MGNFYEEGIRRGLENSLKNRRLFEGEIGQKFISI